MYTEVNKKCAVVCGAHRFDDMIGVRQNAVGGRKRAAVVRPAGEGGGGGTNDNKVCTYAFRVSMGLTLLVLAVGKGAQASTLFGTRSVESSNGGNVDSRFCQRHT